MHILSYTLRKYTPHLFSLEFSVLEKHKVKIGSTSFRFLSSLRGCIVGSGPSGLYTAKYLLKEIPNVFLDIVERLPTPYGLVRAGVAPDHPEVKAVQNDFDKVMNDPRISYFGGVEIGKDVSVEWLKDSYDFIVFACGADGDQKMGIRGEKELKGICGAREFVHWYNGHPDFQYLTEKLQPDFIETAVVIGQGNVALDCARILCKGKLGLLSETDITNVAESMLSKSRLKTVQVIGRRGHVQAKFTIKELREMTRIGGVKFGTRFNELELGSTPASLEELKGNRPKTRISELLHSVAWDVPPQNDISCEARFFLRPVEALPSVQDSSRIGSLKVERTKLEGNPNSLKPVGTGEYEEIPCEFLLRSIGYKPVPIEGVPFCPKTQVIKNLSGRVLSEEIGNVIPGMYCVGWAKRGPTGIIGTNITDARETVASIRADLHKHQNKTNNGIEEYLHKINKYFFTWNDYKTIDEEEKRLCTGKPRTKITSVTDMKHLIKSKLI